MVAKEEIFKFYENLYKETAKWRPKMDDSPLHLIDLDDREWMEREFEKEEVTGALTDIWAEKPPGSDGLTMAFFSKLMGNS